MHFPFTSTLPLAHRGAHGAIRSANSLEALRYAIDLGAPAVELDFVGLADGVLVVSHERTVAIDGVVVDLARSHSSDVAGMVPFGEPFLDAIAQAEGLLFNLDWKGSGSTGPVDDALTSHALVDRTVVSCANVEVVATMKRSHPWMTVGLSVPDLGDGPASVVASVGSCGADAVMLNKLVANEETVAALRSHGYGVFVWTANDVVTYARLAALAPDGIATDVIEEQLVATPGAQPTFTEVQP